MSVDAGIEIDRRSALSSISKSQVDNELAEMMLNGSSDYRIQSAEDLDRFYMMRHNWMHYLVVMNFGLPFQDDFNLESYLNLNEISNPDCIREHKYWDLIKVQTPDIIKLDSNGVVLLIDITVRASEEQARRDKQAKYLTMQIAFKDCGYDCEVIPIVFDSAARMNQVDQVIEQLDDLKLSRTQSFRSYRQTILRILDTAKQMEINCRMENPLGYNTWVRVGPERRSLEYRLDLREDDIRNLIADMDYDPLGGHDPAEILEDPNMNSLEVTDDDEIFLDKCAQRIFEDYKQNFDSLIKPILGRKAMVKDSVANYISTMRSHTSEDKKALNPHKKCFIFPCCSDIRFSSDMDEFQCLTNIFQNLIGDDHHSLFMRSLGRQILDIKETGGDRLTEFLGSISDNDRHLGLDRSGKGCLIIPMSRTQKAWHQAEGPGRKNLLRNGFKDPDPTVQNIAKSCVLSDRDKKTAVLPWDTNIENLERFVEDLSTTDHVGCSLNVDHSCDYEIFPKMDDMIDRATDFLSSLLSVKWLSFIQMISQEIARNATRKRKGAKYCVSLCPDRRYGIILSPGFRITSTSRPIWFKIFSTTKMPPDYGGGLFPEVFDHGSCWSTEWRAIDIYQIESFIRIRDSYIMSLLSYSESSNPGLDDSEHLKKVTSKSDIAGVIAIIMAAHNRSTSTVIQSARYLALRMMSVNPDPTSLLMKDFNVPIRNKVLLFLLHRLCNFVNQMSDYKMADLQGKMKSGYDENTGDVLDLDVDQPDDLPYVFCKGDGQSFTGLLCEIYFCMLFNKNQDEPASAALSILEKIVAEEDKLNNRSLPEGFHTGLLSDDECIEIASGGFVSHFFSARAVTLGAKLQSKHEMNKKPKGGSFFEVLFDNKLVKPLDKFATFKASTISVEENLDLSGVDPFACSDAYEELDQIADEDDLERISQEYDLTRSELEILNKRFRGEQLTPEERYLNNGILEKVTKKSNPLRHLANRTKCVVNVVKILEENPDCVTNVDFLRKHIKNIRALIQIFKKNQIGGAREIEILTMDMRILLEYIERIPTSISKYDEREMISAKQKKGEIIKSNVMRMLSESAGRPLLNLNSCRDMSKWSQAFMPIIFFYSILPYRSIGYDYVKSNMFAQILMSNKKFELPAKLIELWLKNPNEKHSDKAMQKLKEEFLLQDRKSMDCTYKCRSGMGQGLEQTGSTVLHLGQLSFRDELLKRVMSLIQKFCEEKGHKLDLWYRHFDAVSSDDKSTYKLMSTRFPDNLICLSVFRKVENFSEALFCMQDSERKSVELINLAEFNSEFTMRYNQYSPLIKFAHKSVLVPDTRSPLRAISQLYGTVRELRANGASSFLCRYAHYLNKDFIEGIFLTKPNQMNDPSLVFDCHRQYCPADLGVYPIFQPEIMDMAGLEYHNYLVLIDSSAPAQIKCLISYLYQSGDSLTGSDYASVERDYIADTLPRRVHIEISVGMSANLVRAREECPVTKQELEDQLDPDHSTLKIIDLVGDSQTNNVSKLKSASLLYTLGAKDSFKNTNGALYYARIGAMASSSAFHIRNAESTDVDKGLTKGQRFINLVLWLKKRAMGYENIRIARQMLDHFSMYNKCRLCSSVETFSERRPGFRLLKSRKVKTYCKSIILKNRLSDVLNYKWGKYNANTNNSIERDWEIMLRRLPYLKDSEVDTLRAMNVRVTGSNLYKLLIELVKVSTEKNEYSKWLIVGSSTSDLISTSFNLRYSNSFGGLIGKEIDYIKYSAKVDENNEISHFRYCVNSLIMDLNLSNEDLQYQSIERFRKHMGKLSYGDSDLLDKISNMGRSGYLDVQDMKRLLLSQMLMNRSESEIQETLYKLNHSYIVWVTEQERDGEKWTGAFDVMIKSGRSSLRMTGHSDMRGLAFQFVSDRWDSFQMYGMLDSLVKIWYPDGLKKFSMSELRSRCRSVVKSDFGILLLKTTEMRIPELRKMDPAPELIPLKFADGWRSEDFYFDYRQIDLEIGPMIKMFTTTRMGRVVRFAGIYNGIIPIHPSELANIEKSHELYPYEPVRLLTKAGYQTNNRSLERLDHDDKRSLLSLTKKQVLADHGSIPELERLMDLYGVQGSYTASDLPKKQSEEVLMYDQLLMDLTREPDRPPEVRTDHISERDFFAEITLEQASEVLTGTIYRDEFEDAMNTFQDEAFMGAINPTFRLKPKVMVTQPPVNWGSLASIYEKLLIEVHLPKLKRNPTTGIWVDMFCSLSFSDSKRDWWMHEVHQILLKYCLENIRLVSSDLQEKFLEGDLQVSDVMNLNPDPINMNFLSLALK